MIPKTIFSYWHDSKNIPEIVKLCIKSWKHFNPDFEIKIYNKEKMFKEELSNLNEKFLMIINKLSIQAQADFYRLFLLEKYGGIWMDSSIIMYDKIKDIDFNSTNIYGFSYPGNAKLLENWFFACPKNHKFINLWKKEFTYAIIIGFNKYKLYFKSFICLLKKNKINNSIANNFLKKLPYLTQHACFIILKLEIMIGKILLLFNHNILLKPSELGPYKFLYSNNWNSRKACKNLFEKNYFLKQKRQLGYFCIKLRSRERSLIEGFLKKKIFLLKKAPLFI